MASSSDPSSLNLPHPPALIKLLIKISDTLNLFALHTALSPWLLVLNAHADTVGSERKVTALLYAVLSLKKETNEASNTKQMSEIQKE